MKTASRLILLAAVVLFASLPLPAAGAGFLISINGFADDAMLPPADGFNQMSADHVHSCGGTNHAPGFVWTNPPAKTQSYAILEVDPDGRGGLGVDHWVVYNIPGSATTISSDDIAGGKFTPGRGTGDVVGYRGPCPPMGDAPHHYVLTLYALDIPPALPAGLDHEGVITAVKGHIVGATTAVFRFQR
jgi:Raf kinase inhibitor-like YbhB/YbcL family protein